MLPENSTRLPRDDGMQAFACEHHARLHQFLVELAHLGQQLFARHHAGFGFVAGFDNHQNSHVFLLGLGGRAPIAGVPAAALFKRRRAPDRTGRQVFRGRAVRIDTAAKRISSPTTGQARAPALTGYSAVELDRRLEAAPEHAHAVERQVLGIGHAGQPRVGHHLLVDAVAIAAVLVDDPREDHDLAVLQLHRLRERGDLARLHVIADAFGVLQRAVLQPDLAGLARQLLVGIQVLAGNRQHVTIDVAHLILRCVVGWGLLVGRAPS